MSSDINVLTDLVGKLLNRVAVLESENAALKSENAELLARLNQNSSNSHKPPSSDGLKKKPALPQSKGKKTGGQFGHKGKTLEMVPNPDQIVVHHAVCCPCCAKVFAATDVELIAQKRQVFDIPEPRLQVVEHQIGIITCCGLPLKGFFPALVGQPVQYGSKIKALSVLLNTDYKVPFERIEQLLGDLYACSFNESTAINANSACFDALLDTEQTIRSEILKADTAHFDETGMRVEGKLHWFHVASTALFTHLFVHKNRGKKALNSTASLLRDYKNWAVHDCWMSYFGFKDCSHALCNAHILRELEALKEHGSVWAPEMKQLLLELFDLSQKATQIVPNKDQWLLKYDRFAKKPTRPSRPPFMAKEVNPKTRQAETYSTV